MPRGRRLWLLYGIVHDTACRLAHGTAGRAQAALRLTLPSCPMIPSTRSRAFWRLSAAELASLIRKREVSAVQARKALARLDAVNSRINAVVDHRPEDVLSQAAALDQRLARGEDPGPLAGVPVTVKVNVDQAGYATTNGVTLQKDVIAQANNPVVDNLLRAGAVVLGRTNTPAFSLRWFTSNQLHGDTRNPRNAALTPGGLVWRPPRPWRPASVISRTAPTSRARSAIRPMLAACMACGPRWAAWRPLTRPCPSARWAGRSRPCPVPGAQHRRLAPGAGRDGRARSARSVVGARAAGGAGRRSAWRCVSIPMAWRPSPRWSRRCRTRPGAWARLAGASIRWTRSRR